MAVFSSRGLSHMHAIQPIVLDLVIKKRQLMVLEFVIINY